MALVTEFRLVSHDFHPEDDHGAAFVGKAADAQWFYRFDSTFIEVRDVFTCQEKIFASLSTVDIKQRFRDLIRGDEVKFVHVRDAYVGEFYVLVLVVRDTQEERDHVFVWNLLTLHLKLLVSPQRGLTAVTVTPQQAIMVSHRLVKSWGKGPSPRPQPSPPVSPRSLISDGSRSSRSSSSSSLLQSHHLSHDTTASIDLDDEEEEDDCDEEDDNRIRIRGNRRQLLVLGHEHGWVSIYKFTVTFSGQVISAKITSFATLSNKNLEAIPVIVAGTEDAKVFVIKYNDVHGSKKLELLMALEDLKSKTLPITNITIQRTEENLDILVVGQGRLPGASESGEYPIVSIYTLRQQRSDYRLLGYVQPPMMEGEVASGGRTLSATVCEDRNGLRIHCAFSTLIDNSTLRSNLTTVQINNNDVQNLDVVEMTANEGGTLLDISPQTNSYELVVLYLNKLVNYVQAADLEWSRRELGNPEGEDGQESILRDLAPSYATFFLDNGKFTYTESELTEIERRRELLGGKLFYDRLLEFLELPEVFYPPRTHDKQRNLWTNIYHHGNLETDNRNCLAYYLLKDQHGDISEQFLREYMIPPKFVDLMNGFWALDHFEFKNAVLYLSRPGLIVDWVEDVIDAVYQHGSAHLARQFIVAANLKLSSERFVDSKMRILLETDFTEAFYFQRSYVPSTNENHQDIKGDKDVEEVSSSLGERSERLFRILLDYCFLDKPNRSAIKMVLLLTMTEHEEQMFVRYCDSHSGLTREVAQEFLIMYYVNHCRHLEAVRMHRKLYAIEREKEEEEQFHREALERRNSRQFGATATGQGQGHGQELSKSQKRKMLIDNLIKVLPVTQRVALELELEQDVDGTTKTSAHQPITSLPTFRAGHDDKDKTTKRNKKMNGAESHSTDYDSSKGVIRSLMHELDGPLTSLKGLDLDWAIGSWNDYRLGPEGADDLRGR
ncbi:hypothetical protein BGX28_002164 [Mortierella sp. GBA30]|nr:hypothetical protein BGX28_002164 [Mortierella sp. GBA30]